MESDFEGEADRTALTFSLLSNPEPLPAFGGLNHSSNLLLLSPSFLLSSVVFFLPLSFSLLPLTFFRPFSFILLRPMRLIALCRTYGVSKQGTPGITKVIK